MMVDDVSGGDDTRLPVPLGGVTVPSALAEFREPMNVMPIMFIVPHPGLKLAGSSVVDATPDTGVVACAPVIR